MGLIEGWRFGRGVALLVGFWRVCEGRTLCGTLVFGMGRLGGMICIAYVVIGMDVFAGTHWLAEWIQVCNKDTFDLSCRVAKKGRTTEYRKGVDNMR